MTLWNIILETNTFNFIILMIIVAIVLKKIKISSIIENIREDILSSINSAKLQKENSIEMLKDAQSQHERLDNELKSHQIETEQKIEAIKKQISSDTQAIINSIEHTTNASIISEEKTLNNAIINKILKSSTEKAEKLIIKKLRENPELHNKFIEESIGEL